MNCVEARERILEADLPELRETGASDLSKHLRLCARCRGAAERILREELALANALAALEPTAADNKATDHPAVGDARTIADRTTADRQRSAPRRWWWAVAAPALAAAGLVGIMVTRGTVTVDPEAGVIPTLEMLPPTPLIEPAAARDFAVFETDNPDIVVVWFF